MVVTKVQRPCLITVNTESMDVLLAVNGDAMEASPSLTMVGSISCSCSSYSSMYSVCMMIGEYDSNTLMVKIDVNFILSCIFNL